MRIGVISDLHIDRHPTLYTEDYVEALSLQVRRKSVELLIIAGDIANQFELVNDFLKELKGYLNIRILFIPGNHDFWSDHQSYSSLEVLEMYKRMDGCLLAHPHIIDDEWAIIGHTGWYDYSYASNKFSVERLARGKYYGATWQDKVRIDWPYEDRELSKHAAQLIENDLQSIGNRKAILVTHIVTHPAFAVPLPHRLFDFYNAYIGTSDIEPLYRRFPIRYSVMGHVHFRKRMTEKGITYICPCLGYQRQWRTQDISQEISDALQVIDL
ncbi:metallophosphoesterase [Staphylococcus sp. SQ8-PEA]|uniref:Metallophosphoesterase n=1 Tax=Staphylococcus marylandisciuri TaxID=2981529 RepID=A0ABT2QMU8_9STAP|nr:metallophosphoesterase [Staphylococcus marylandisciuri]MCU5745297.1 metallophosphoesterase [Staphylococcus marylandisciuri]